MNSGKVRHGGNKNKRSLPKWTGQTRMKLCFNHSKCLKHSKSKSIKSMNLGSETWESWNYHRGKPLKNMICPTCKESCPWSCWSKLGGLSKWNIDHPPDANKLKIQKRKVKSAPLPNATKNMKSKKHNNNNKQKKRGTNKIRRRAPRRWSARAR